MHVCSCRPTVGYYRMWLWLTQKHITLNGRNAIFFQKWTEIAIVSAEHSIRLTHSIHQINHNIIFSPRIINHLKNINQRILAMSINRLCKMLEMTIQTTFPFKNHFIFIPTKHIICWTNVYSTDVCVPITLHDGSVRCAFIFGVQNCSSLLTVSISVTVFRN